MKDERQQYFDFLLGTSSWFTAGEAATILHMKKTYVHRLMDEGKLLTHSHGLGNGGESAQPRKHRRITRESLMLYLLASADYTTEDKRDVWESVIRTQDADMAEFIARAAGEQSCRMLARKH